MRSYLESYRPGHDDGEYDRITKTGGTYCGTFGPEEILGGLSEFLGYFMPRKVMASKAAMQAAGTATKKLVWWLAAKGFLRNDEELEFDEKRAGKAARELSDSQTVVDLLEAHLDEHAPPHNSREMEDHFTITRTEPGKLWLEPFVSGERGIGPVLVPRQVSQLCKVGWDIGGVIVKTSKGWRLPEVWNVSP